MKLYEQRQCSDNLASCVYLISEMYVNLTAFNFYYGMEKYYTYSQILLECLNTIGS